MPTVPTYERQVAPAPLPGVRKRAAATPESEGAGVALAQGELARAKGEATAHVAGAVAHLADTGAQIGTSIFAQIAERERQAANETKDLKSSNSFDDWENDRVWNEQHGLLRTVRGEAAMSLPEQIDDEFEKKADEIAGTLNTPEQHMAFERLRAQRRERLRVEVHRYVAGEIDRFRDEQIKAKVGNGITNAIRNFGHPDAFAVDLGDVVDAIRQNGKTDGLPADTVKKQVLAAQSQAHLGAIRNLLALERAEDAREWFTRSKKQIDPESWDDVEKALEESTLRKQSQVESDRIIAKGGPLTAQLEEARKIDDSKLRDAVEQRIEHRDSVLERAKREDEENRMRQGYDIVDKTYDAGAIPTTLWTSYDGSTRSALISYAEKRAKGIPVETDMGTLADLITLRSSRPEAFVRTNLLAYANRIDKPDLQRLLEEQGQLRAGMAPDPKFFASEATQGQIIDAALPKIGVDESKAKKDNDKAALGRIAAFRRAVREAVVREQAKPENANRNVPDSAVQSIVDTLIAPTGKVGGGWFSSGRQAFAFETAQAKVTTIDQVPVAERRKIEEALRGRGYNDQTIIDLFNRRLQEVRKDR